jgi:iron complex transport system ATP-binding protein
MTPELLAEVFEVDAAIMTDPVHGRPICIPRGRARAATQELA